jgi:hypothetical protein
MNMENQQSGGAPRPPLDPMEPVVEFLKGTDPDLICRQYGVTRAELDMWLEAYRTSQRKMALADQLVIHRVGRNEPCPCGSGKKYKKCCLPQHEEARKAVPPERLKEMEELARAREQLAKDIAKGYDLLLKEEYGKADRLADQLLTAYPEDDRLHDMAVSIALATGDYEKAYLTCLNRWQVATQEKQFYQEFGFHQREGKDVKKPVHFYSSSTWLENLWIAQRARTYREQYPQPGNEDLARMVLQLKAANDVKRFTGRQAKGYEERQQALAPVLVRVEKAGDAAIPYVLPLTYVFSWASLFVPEFLRAWKTDACLRLLGELSMFRFPYFAQMCLTHLESFGERALPVIDDILQREAAFDELKGGLLSILGNIHTPESYAILIRMIDHDNPHIVKWVAQALEQHENPDAAPHLERAKARLGELSKIAGAIRELAPQQLGG